MIHPEPARPPLRAIYLVVTGAGTARRIPALIPLLTGLGLPIRTILTPNAQRVVSPRELALVPGHRMVESYFDEAILPRPPGGLVLVAPCDFNSLNKLALGVADTLALSVTAEAIGRGTPLVIAISCNEPLWRHPRAQESAATLERWGCHVLAPTREAEVVTMTGNEAIAAAVRGEIDRYRRSYDPRPSA